jgi:hypothetical protein
LMDSQFTFPKPDLKVKEDEKPTSANANSNPKINSPINDWITGRKKDTIWNQNNKLGPKKEKPDSETAMDDETKTNWQKPITKGKWDMNEESFEENKDSMGNMQQLDANAAQTNRPPPKKGKIGAKKGKGKTSAWNEESFQESDEEDYSDVEVKRPPPKKGKFGAKKGKGKTSAWEEENLGESNEEDYSEVEVKRPPPKKGKFGSKKMKGQIWDVSNIEKFCDHDHSNTSPSSKQKFDSEKFRRKKNGWNDFSSKKFTNQGDFNKFNRKEHAVSEQGNNPHRESQNFNRKGKDFSEFLNWLQFNRQSNENRETNHHPITRPDQHYYPTIQRTHGNELSQFGENVFNFKFPELNLKKNPYLQESEHQNHFDLRELFSGNDWSPKHSIEKFPDHFNFHKQLKDNLEEHFQFPDVFTPHFEKSKRENSFDIHEYFTEDEWNSKHPLESFPNHFNLLVAQRVKKQNNPLLSQSIVPPYFANPKNLNNFEKRKSDISEIDWSFRNQDHNNLNVKPASEDHLLAMKNLWNTKFDFKSQNKDIGFPFQHYFGKNFFDKDENQFPPKFNEPIRKQNLFDLIPFSEKSKPFSQFQFKSENEERSIHDDEAENDESEMYEPKNNQQKFHRYDTLSDNSFDPSRKGHHIKLTIYSPMNDQYNEDSFDDDDVSTEERLWKTQNNGLKSEESIHDPWNWSFEQEEQDESGILKDKKKTRIIKQFEIWNVEHRNQVMRSQKRNNKFSGEVEKRKSGKGRSLNWPNEVIDCFFF